jgi:hypothetical protein
VRAVWLGARRGFALHGDRIRGVVVRAAHAKLCRAHQCAVVGAGRVAGVGERRPPGRVNLAATSPGYFLVS